MVQAIGYSQTAFNLTDPGRLCRGRERWIDPWEVDGEVAPLHRMVISGAAFTDDSARDALRGVGHGGVAAAAVIAALFPRKELLAFMEDGHPEDIPEDAEHVELYEAHRAGGRSEVTAVRWVRRLSGVRALREVFGPEAQADRVRGFVVLPAGVEVDDLLDPLFLLVGMSNLDSPPARFQPLALPELLTKVPAVILVHRDKHGVALGVYSEAPLDLDARLIALAEKKDALVVPFAIPPMLARWDRALGDARTVWEGDHDEPFPVPVSAEPSLWDRRRRGRRRRHDDADEPAHDQPVVARDDAPVASRESVPPEIDLDDDDLFMVEEDESASVS